MFSIGDTVLRDLFIGVVVAVTDREVTCCCADYKQRTFKASECTLVNSSSTTLKAFERSILHANR